jgi:hypothetical protein
MRSSLIVLAVVLATMRVVQAALARHMRRASLVPAVRRRGSAAVGVSELSLADGVTVRSGTAEAGRRRGGRGAAAAGDRAPSRFTEWRYYGFSNHPAEADASAAEPSEVVATSPEVGSVVSLLPDGCVTTVVNGCVYRQCGSVWYQRQYTGSDVTYVVVRAP